MSEQTETELKKIANHIMNRVGRIRQRKLELQMIIAHESARKLSNEESFVTNEGVQVSPTKQEQAASPVKHEEAAEPMKHEEAAEPMKHEEAAEPLKVEEVLEPAKHEEAAVPDEPVAKPVDEVKEVVEQVHEEAKVSESFDEIKHEEIPVET